MTYVYMNVDTLSGVHVPKTYCAGCQPCKRILCILTDHVCKNMLTIMSPQHTWTTDLRCEQSPSPSHVTNTTFHEKVSSTQTTHIPKQPRDRNGEPLRTDATSSIRRCKHGCPTMKNINGCRSFLRFKQVSCRLRLVMRGGSPPCMSTLLARRLRDCQHKTYNAQYQL